MSGALLQDYGTHIRTFMHSISFIHTYIHTYIEKYTYIQTERLPSEHTQFITTGSASRSKIPLKVQVPPLAQAQISTCGLRTEPAWKLSTAKNATEILSGDASTHLNVYTVPSVTSEALNGVSPITETVKLSLSVTLKVYIDFSPVLTRNLDAPLIAGG